MSQSRRHSIEETIISTLVGLGVSTILNWTYVPWVLHTQVTVGSNMALTAVFTAVSIMRGYSLRRLFNWRTQRAVAINPN